MRSWQNRVNRGGTLQRRWLQIESLESRRVFAALPFGATEADLGEFMLGSVAVTPVFLESNGQIDASTEDWTSAHIQEVLAKIDTGLEWWVDTLDSLSTFHELSFTVDTTYALTPVSTSYEPISRRSNDYVLWVDEFLSSVGFASGSLERDIRAFNQSQREKLGTDWSFTMFVVPSVNDADGQFAPGGSFGRAFAFAGGLFMVVPSTRPASTFTHETGHMFWARDEYAGGGTFFSRRGYYNTQNINAADNPTPGFVQQPSIMAAGTLLDTAYASNTSPASTLAMLGWQDSDGNGIFDVLDVPHRLTGSGYFDVATGNYRFVGAATVQTLPNLNSSGLRNDITLNKIRQIEYRFDGGQWLTALLPDAYQTDLDLTLPVPSGSTEIEIRAVDTRTTVTSNVFRGPLEAASATLVPGINGSVWIDANGNGLRDVGELGEAGWTVELVNAQGAPLELGGNVEPDDYEGLLGGNFRTDVTLRAVGANTDGRVAVFADSGASTGSKVFWGYSNQAQSFLPSWNSGSRLQIDFAVPTGRVSIDAIGPSSSSFGRLEAYNSGGQLLGRVTTAQLTNNVVETMEIIRGTNDIAYVIASGHMGSSVKLDKLQFGANTATVTDVFGTYAFSGLPAGEYNVRLSTASGYRVIGTSGGLQTVLVTANEATSDIVFGVQESSTYWQNPRDAADVNDDGAITPLDILLIVNEINAGGIRDLTGSTLSTPPFVDTSGDNFLSALDILLVINRLNQNGSGEGEQGGGTYDAAAGSNWAVSPTSFAPTSASPWQFGAGFESSEEDEDEEGLLELLASNRGDG